MPVSEYLPAHVPHSLLSSLDIRITVMFFLVANPCQVRLAGGSVPWEGRVEVKINDAWGRICDNSYWSEENKVVFCRQLGYAGVVG